MGRGAGCGRAHWFAVKRVSDEGSKLRAEQIRGLERGWQKKGGERVQVKYLGGVLLSPSLAPIRLTRTEAFHCTFDQNGLTAGSQLLRPSHHECGLVYISQKRHPDLKCGFGSVVPHPDLHDPNGTPRSRGQDQDHITATQTATFCPDTVSFHSFWPTLMLAVVGDQSPLPIFIATWCGRA
jgi:hypothetical protein